MGNNKRTRPPLPPPLHQPAQITSQLLPPPRTPLHNHPPPGKNARVSASSGKGSQNSCWDSSSSPFYSRFLSPLHPPATLAIPSTPSPPSGSLCPSSPPSSSISSGPFSGPTCFSMASSSRSRH